MIIKHNIQITPEQAQQILDNKPDEQYKKFVMEKMQQDLVDQYADLMKKKEWDNLKGIVILYQNKLRTDEYELEKCELWDGHHRMSAVVKSDTPTNFKIAFIDEEDLNEYSGFAYPRTFVHAAILYARMLDKDEMNLREFFLKNPKIVDSVMYGRSKDNEEFVDFGDQKRPMLRKKFVLACLHFIFLDGNIERGGHVKEFLGGLCFDKNPSPEMLKIREFASSAENEDILIKCKYLKEEWDKWISKREY